MSGYDGTRCGSEPNDELDSLREHGEGDRVEYGFDVLDLSTGETHRITVNAVSGRVAWGKVLDAFGGDVHRLETKHSAHHDLSDWNSLDDVTDNDVEWGIE